MRGVFSQREKSRVLQQRITMRDGEWPEQPSNSDDMVTSGSGSSFVLSNLHQSPRS